MFKQALKTPLGDALYIAAFEVILLKHILDATALYSRPEAFNNVLIVVFFALIVPKLILQKYTIKSLFLLGVLTIVVCVSCLSGRFSTLIYGYFLIIAIQGVDFTKLIKVSCYSKVAILLFHVISYIIAYSLFGVTGSIVRGGRVRHAFFIGHPNTFTFIMTWTLLELIFIHYKKIRLIHLIAAWIIVFISYQFTDSNSGIMVFSVVFVLMLCDKYLNVAVTAILTAMTKFGHIIFSLFFLIYVWIFPTLTGVAREVWLAINEFFNGRTLFGSYAMSTYGTTLFGRRIHFPPKVYWQGFWIDFGEAIHFDNYYLGQYVLFGILNLILISLAFFVFSKRMENREKIIIIAFIFYGMMEAYVTTGAYCFALLIIGKYIFDPKRKTIVSSNTINEEHVPLWKRKSA